MESDTIHEETLPIRLGLIAAVLLSACAVLMLVLLVLQLTGDLIGGRPVADWFCALMFVVMSTIAVLVTSFRKLTIRLTTQSLTVAFGMFRRTILWGDIEHCSRDESSSLAYGGWGIRVARVSGRWRIVYNVAGHPGILLGLRTGRFRELVFSTDNAEQVLDTVSKYCVLDRMR